MKSYPLTSAQKEESRASSLSEIKESIPKASVDLLAEVVNDIAEDMVKYPENVNFHVEVLKLLADRVQVLKQNAA